jgi:transcriptional regulator with GAF, ATPase, and Fis domain
MTCGQKPDGRGFARPTADLGVLSMVSFQLFVQDDTFGALNIYSEKARAFGPQSESDGMLLASHAAVAMTATRTEAGLLIAMDSRDLIAQAAGGRPPPGRHRRTPDASSLTGPPHRRPPWALGAVG